MVDRTNDYYNLISSVNDKIVHKSKIKVQSNKIIVLEESVETLKNIISYEKLIERIVENYVGYHRFLPNNMNNIIMTDDETKEFDHQLAMFISNVISNLDDLKMTLQEDFNNKNFNSCFYYQNEIINYLFNRLNELMKISKLLQKERSKYNINPFKLLSNNTKLISNNISISTSISSNNKSKTNNSSIVITKESLQELSSRYNDEITTINKLKEYNNISNNLKQQLLKESTLLHNQYKQDIEQVNRIEHSIESISSMMSEFVRILHTQTDQVEDIYDTSQYTHNYVKQSNQQLQVTIDKSLSSQWNMILLSFTLGLLLILLDLITP